MAHEGGPEGCLPCGPNSQCGLTLSSVLCIRLPLSVHMPSIQPVVYSLDLYQDLETSHNPAQKTGGEASGVHRQLCGHGRVPEISERPHPWFNLSAGESRFYRAPRKICDNFLPGIGVSRHGYSFLDDGALPPKSESKEKACRSREIVECNNSAHCSQDVTPPGKIEFTLSGSSSRTAFLPSDSEGSASGAARELPVLQDSLPAIRCGRRRTVLVDRPIKQVEWKEPGIEEPRCPGTQMPPSQVG